MINNKILSKLGSYAIAGIIFLGCIILYAGLGTRANSPNIYFIMIGLVILSPFVVYFMYHKMLLSKKEKQHERELIEFKKRAEKIPVNLEDLEINSNSWNDTVITDQTQYAGFNDLMGNSYRNIKTTTTNLNFVIIKIPYQGKTIEYHLSIPMDTTKLKIHFAIKKETILYIDPMDENNMYLDLEFLE